MQLTFVETSSFTNQLTRLMSDEDYLALQQTLLRDPEVGAVIQGTGGLRKIRWRDSRRDRGKRGGLRVIYYFYSEHWEIWFLAMYDKSNRSDLTTDERNQLASAIRVAIKERRQSGGRESKTR